MLCTDFFPWMWSIVTPVFLWNTRKVNNDDIFKRFGNECQDSTSKKAVTILNSGDSSASFSWFGKDAVAIELIIRGVRGMGILSATMSSVHILPNWHRCVMRNVLRFVRIDRSGQTPSVYHCLQNQSGYDSDKFIRQSRICMIQSKLMLLGSDHVTQPGLSKSKHQIAFVGLLIVKKTVSVTSKVVQRKYTGNSSALCLGFPIGQWHRSLFPQCVLL